MSDDVRLAKRREYYVDAIAVGRSTGFGTTYKIFNCYDKKRHEKSVYVREVLPGEITIPLELARELVMRLDDAGNVIFYESRIHAECLDKVARKLEALLPEGSHDT